MKRRLMWACAVLATAMLAMLALSATALVPASAATTTTTAELTGIRVGRHATFDRVVLDLTGPSPTVSHRFVTTLTADPSDRPVILPCPTRTERFLLVTARPAAAHNENGQATYRGPGAFCTPSLRNVRAVGITGDFEGVLSIGLGLRHRAWVHVFTLTGPSRVVIDIGR
ncbi:MAG TPA: hypothetical protein VHC18_26535 [Amycolatopsis sp.]|nr:hypothetical protein [Amycolatopsis sp.]